MNLPTLLFATALIVSQINARDSFPPENRQGRLFSLFSIVSFGNEPCFSTTTTASGNRRSGHCYTASQCQEKSGVSVANCASGFGVCCIFFKTSGTVNQNCTYIRNEGFPSAFTGTTAPSFTIQKCSPNVCFLRLDFESFTLTGPTGSLEATNGGQCATESMTFTTPAGITYPTICGNNAGEHVYVDLGNTASNTATLAFALSGNNAIFEIKVTQVPCSSTHTPPPGCFQYHTGIQGQIRTFNFQDTTTSHLANQNYKICIRREFGMCCNEYQVCPNEPNSMSLSGQAVATDTVVDRNCNSDYVSIQGLTARCVSPGVGPLYSRLCGREWQVAGGADGTEDALNSGPLCDCREPFDIHIFTDDAGEAQSATTPNRGLCLQYRQLPC